MRAPIWAPAGLLLAMTLAGCSPQEVVVPASAPVSSPATPDRPGAAGAAFRDIPPIVIPDVTALTESASSFAGALASLATPVSGVSVVGARCDTTGKVVNRGSLTEVNNGDGSGAFQDGSLAVSNDGNGSGVYTDGSLSIVVAADGSGSLTDGSLSIAIAADGSGAYTDGSLSIQVDGDGSGSLTDGAVSITNDGRGAGTYTEGALTITNAGDGSGTSVEGSVAMVNHGNGTGTVNGRPVAMQPLPPMPPVGKFPPVGALAPVGRACGTLIRLSDRVLFDFDQAVLRPQAGPVLDQIATALDSAPGPLRINGHTDALGADAYNLDLSQRRAAAVADGLGQRGVRASMEAAGFGETQPIAANELDGHDNPGGRQLNRRVEIVIPNG